MTELNAAAATSAEPTRLKDITPEQAQAFLAKRDLTVDLVRVFCVMLVVVIHTMMVGIATTKGIQVTEPATQHAWFPYATWFLQIMPLFFIVGGFASWQGWHSVVRKGQAPTEFFRARVLRLVYPALIWFLVVGLGMWAAMLIGAPVELLNQLAIGVAQPLWFLAAYLIVQFCVPLMVRLHTSHRRLTPLALLAAAIVVDALRYSTGITQIGLANLFFVWLLAQQIGFFYADGTLARISRKLLPIITLAAFGVVALLGSARELLHLRAGYSLDMLDNLNPPTVPLLFVGIAHTAILLLLKPALDRLMQRRGTQGAVLFLGGRAMTIYLWHLIFVILLAATVLVVPLPQPDTAAWWWTRIPSVLGVFLLVFLVSLLVARFERGPNKRKVYAAPNWGIMALVFLLAVIPPFFAMELLLNLNAYLWGSVLLMLAVLLSMGKTPGKTSVS